MNKYRTLKAVGFFVVLTVIVAFLALPDSQAGAAKPIKWKVTISGLNLNAPGEFFGGQDQVNINYGLGTNDSPCSGPGTSGAYSYLELQVFNPILRFTIDNITSSGSTTDPARKPDASGFINLAPYGLPNNLNIWPGCVANFLNTYDQPTAEYPHIILRFTTCGCENTTTDFLKMGQNEILPVHMLLQFFSHNWDCPASSPFSQKTFLNLLMNAHGYRVGTIPVEIYIRRVNDVWTATVETDFNNVLYPAPPDDYALSYFPGTKSDGIIGQYATCVTTGKGKNAVSILKYYYPWAKTHLSFQIVFTKL